MYINLWGLFDAKDSIIDEQQGYYLTNSWGGDNEIHTFLKYISPKVNIIALLEIELAYFEAIVRTLATTPL